MYQDVSGPEMARLLTEMSAAPDFALNMIINQTAVVADDIGTKCFYLRYSYVTGYLSSFLPSFCFVFM